MLSPCGPKGSFVTPLRTQHPADSVPGNSPSPIDGVLLLLCGFRQKSANLDSQYILPKLFIVKSSGQGEFIRLT